MVARAGGNEGLLYFSLETYKEGRKRADGEDGFGDFFLISLPLHHTSHLPSALSLSGPHPEDSMGRDSFLCCKLAPLTMVCFSSYFK
jgi:hypothetical protein